MYTVFDLEVDAKTIRKRFCDPLEKEHTIVMMQKKVPNEDARVIYNADGINPNRALDFKGVLVGHNLKFDMLYIWENPSLRNFLLNGGKVWDTCLADYLLEGQNKKLRYNLSEVSKRYGGTPKIDVVAQALKEGKLFSQIPKDIAIKYGIKDVLDTEMVYLKQIQRAKDQRMLELLQIHMGHLLSVCEQEYNGIHLDLDKLKRKTEDQRALVDTMSEKLRKYLRTNTDWPENVEVDLNSSQQISCILFGGEVKYVDRIPNPDPKTGQTHYKTGKRAGELRTKLAQLSVRINGLGLPKTPQTKNEGYYETGNSSLSEVKHPVIEKILDYRKQYKLLSTYFEGLTPLINPYTGCIHSEFSMRGTATGRLASRNPNVQNLCDGIYQCIYPRQNDRKIYVIDFSQLEVCIAAAVFRDHLLLQEVKNKVDMHLHNAKRLFNKEEVSKKERKIAKFLTFGLLYGQGANAMSYIHKIDVSLAKKFIEMFYNKYMDIAQAHRQLPNEVNARANGDESYLLSPTFKRYYMEKYDNTYGRSFSSTQMKNYKIQGTASDIMSMAAGDVFQYLQHHREHAIIINEVHDSLIIEGDEVFEKEHLRNVVNIMENASNRISEIIGIELNVPLSVDVECGKNYGELKKHVITE